MSSKLYLWFKLGANIRALVIASVCTLGEHSQCSFAMLRRLHAVSHGRLNRMESKEEKCHNISVESPRKHIHAVETCTTSGSSPTCSDPLSTGIQESNVEKLHNLIERDTNACDLLFSLFTSALLSYRRHTVLRPCPPNFSGVTDSGLLDPTQKNFERMKTVSGAVPPLTSLLLLDNARQFCLQSSESADLLKWVLSSRTFSLHSVDKSMFETIKAKTGQVVDTPSPTHIFEVYYCSSIESRFQGKDLIYAYHGSRLENFHSILHNGLQNHMNKNSVFGEGTYLSGDMSVCMPYSPTGLGWHRSLLGENISCIAVCEIIPHPDVKCHTKVRKGNPSLTMRAKDIVGDGIPEKYYIVQNDELVRVKYLLAFTNYPNTRLASEASVQPRNWFLEHKFVLFMMAYGIVLLAVGLSNKNYVKLLYNKLFS